MKKLLIPTFALFLTFSCSKQETQQNETAVVEKNVPAEDVNEMTALMEEMMEEMHSDKPTGNNDADFSKMMIEHHKGAVDMSELLLEKGKDEELKKFAKQIITAQNQEITLMQKFEDKKEVSPDSENFSQDLNRSMAAMMNKNIKIHDDIDKDFAEQMIPHHQSAVDMAEVYLKYGKNTELIKLSNDIVKAQTTEIAFLKEWLQRK